MLGAVVWTLWPVPCGKPVAYRLGPVDDRFGLSGDEVLAALGEAGALWEQGLGRKLFTYDARAQLTVTLVFDDRQQTTQGGYRLRSAMQDLQASHESVGKSYAEWLATYERRARNYELTYADYQQRAAAFNARVQDLTARGGASPETQAAVQACGLWPRRATAWPRRTTGTSRPSTRSTGRHGHFTRASSTAGKSPSSSSTTGGTSRW